MTNLYVVFKERLLFKFFGDYAAVARPVSIPNTAVKHCWADGSGFIDSARVGRRQLKNRNITVAVFF